MSCGSGSGYFCGIWINLIFEELKFGPVLTRDADSGVFLLRSGSELREKTGFAR